VFEPEGWGLVESVEPRLGETERPIFARAGKAERFDEVCRVPAILIWHFRRSGSARNSETVS